MMSENRKSLNILYCLDRLHLLKSWSQFLGDAILEEKNVWNQKLKGQSKQIQLVVQTYRLR